MSGQKKHILLFCIVSLVVYSSWHIFFVTEKTEVNKPFTKGYSVENIELRITDESGKLAGKFNSPGLVRYTDSDIIHIKKPEFWTYNNGKINWKIDSNSAEFNSNKNEVDFKEKLVAVSLSESPKQQFTSNSLKVLLDKHVAVTNSGIIFKQDSAVMSGINATLDLKKQIIEVNNDVKAVYKPKTNKNS